MANVLEFQNISKTYNEGKVNQVEVLKGLDLHVSEGEVVGLIAPSGYGKSTILHIAGLLDQPSQGDVWIVGENMTTATDRSRTLKRRDEIGFVFQFHHLMVEFSALENVTLPLANAGWASGDASLRAEKLLREIGLGERMKHRPKALSGGEQQRVAICRALANHPKILLADEPTGNLDPENAEKVFDIFIRLAREENMAALVATHNLELAAQMDRVIDLRAQS